MILLCAGAGSTQADAPSRVTISIIRPGELRVEAELSQAVDSWSFRNAYAGVLGIAERVENFQAANTIVRKAVVGEYRSNLKTSKISYTVKLSNPTLADVSHVSWLAYDRGFLMLADLIPIEIHHLIAGFELPNGWTVESSFSRDASGRYEVGEPAKAVFLVGRELRKSPTSVNGMPIEVVLSGRWPFKERKALESAEKVMERNLALTGFRLPRKSVILIAPLPITDQKTSWKAETRGSTLVLLVNPEVKVKRWKSYLTIIFAHELLHLWVPNSLKLAGDYDWFFEGFTLYTALRTSLELKAIDFEEYLDTIGRVFDAYNSQPDTLSLIEESERRWANAGSQVYVKGMLVAFLYDLMVRKETGGQRTLLQTYRELFSRQLADGLDGNEAIINVLGSTPFSRDFVKRYVEGGAKVELKEVLPEYGLAVESSSKGSRIRTGKDLSDDQKKLLRSLGYRG